MTYTLDDAFQELRLAHQSPPKPSVIPTFDDLETIEAELSVSLHSDLRRYLLEVSYVFVGTLQPATASNSSWSTHLTRVVENGREYGVPRELLPFCEDNADFYCLDSEGKVIFWSHNGVVDETWPSMAIWIRDVWIAES